MKSNQKQAEKKLKTTCIYAKDGADGADGAELVKQSFKFFVKGELIKLRA